MDTDEQIQMFLKIMLAELQEDEKKEAQNEESSI